MTPPTDLGTPCPARRPARGRGTLLLPLVVALGVLVVGTSVLIVRHRSHRSQEAHELQETMRSVTHQLEDAAAFALAESWRVAEAVSGMAVHLSGLATAELDDAAGYLAATGSPDRLGELIDVRLQRTPAVGAQSGVTMSHGGDGELDEHWTTTLAATVTGPDGSTTRVELDLDTVTVLDGLTSPAGEPAVGVIPVTPDVARDGPNVVVGDGLVGGEVVVELLGSPHLIRAAAEPAPPPLGRTELTAVAIATLVAALAAAAAARALATARARSLDLVAAADAARDASIQRFRASFEHAPIGMAELSEDGRIVEANPALAGQLGRARQELVGSCPSELVHPQDRVRHERLFEALVHGEHDAVQAELRYLRPDGSEAWIAESISAVPPAQGAPRSFLVQSVDITARRRAAWELARQAMHDELTGLPNRALFLNRLRHALTEAEREATVLAVMFIDIDRFKLVNDSLGHEQGDRFLVEVSRRICTAVRRGDTVARFGGDEFVVLCEQVDGVSEATAVAQRIQAALGAPLDLAGSNVHATASVGITLSVAGDESADALLRDADAAMYRAKEAGRNRAEVFDSAMRTSVVERMAIESDLRGAVSNGEIVMHYQAIVDPLTHLPVGYEALMRWNHPTRGLIGPGAFLDVATDAGMLEQLDSFALDQTCRQIAQWSRRFPASRHLYVSTNWSARDLGHFVQQVEQVLAETAIDPEQLVVEVTETFLLADSEASIQAISRLKQLGVSVAIDDFGTGYSSLSYLTQFDIDHLKIDKSFIDRLPDDHATAAVISAISDMAHVLGINVVAEGVETDEQLDLLLALGAPRLQGYRFAKPRAAQEVTQELADRFDPAHLRRVAAPLWQQVESLGSPRSPFAGVR